MKLFYLPHPLSPPLPDLIGVSKERGNFLKRGFASIRLSAGGGVETYGQRVDAMRVEGGKR
jgi:hypothetical protein